MSKQESVGRRSDGGAAVRATGAWWIGSGWELGLGFGPWSRGSSAAGTGAAIDVERERAACGRPWADPFAFSKPWEEGQPSMPAAWSEVVGFALSQVVNHSALLLHDSSAYVGDHGHNGPPLSVVVTTEDHHHHGEKGEVVVKYRECHKNHAASIGGSATDGCGEFMPSGEEGTPEAFKCSACGCHRNFHRKEAEGEPSCDCFRPFRRRKVMMGQRGFPISGSDAFGYSPARSNSLVPRVVMPLGAMPTSESEEMEGVGGMVPSPAMVKE
ncbi:hypothetical protein B296_00007852 [Ensete ventricosum]|uniref:ZF-HD dimerization-type domain-containing protein n=1 Tax=Ensete ventricosum TaxID=4639 RepID=A0A427AVZ9_ENSVE|nr:hypothetical protein B296_00007852 [Ensete ventricosum]